MAAVITTIAMKGGVGKTTTTVNTAAALASMGFRCLIVDLDGNGSATASLGQQALMEEGSASWALLTGKTWIPRPVEPRLDLFTGDSRLFQADMALGQVIGRERLLERALARFQAEYDYIWLDCPPAWNLLTINSMVSADYYLVPVQAQHLALEALRELVGGVHRIEEGMGRVPKCLGFLLTMVDHRVKATADILQDVKATLKADVLPVSIPMNNALAQAPKFGTHIFGHDRGCKGAAAYMALAAVVTKKTNFKKPKSVKEA